MSSVAVSPSVPPGETVAMAGVTDTREGCSPGPTTRTPADSIVAPREAVSVTPGDCARPLTSTGALTCPAGTVTPPPTTLRLAGSPDMIATNVSIAGALTS